MTTHKARSKKSRTKEKIYNPIKPIKNRSLDKHAKKTSARILRRSPAGASSRRGKHWFFRDGRSRAWRRRDRVTEARARGWPERATRARRC